MQWIWLSTTPMVPRIDRVYILGSSRMLCQLPFVVEGKLVSPTSTAEHLLVIIEIQSHRQPTNMPIRVTVLVKKLDTLTDEAFHEYWVRHRMRLLLDS